MAITPGPDAEPTTPDRGPRRSSPAANRGRVEPAASEAYRSQAGRYDRRTEAFQHWRERLVARLPVRPGDTVLDVGCGTGLCLPLLHDKVGPTGTNRGHRRLRADAAGRRRPGHHPRLGQRPARRRPGRAGTDRRPRRRCPVLRGTRRAAIPGRVWAASSSICVPARPWPRAAGNRPDRCCGHMRGWVTLCTHRSSPTSPASTSRGDCWPSSSPTCGSTNTPSAPDTWPWVTTRRQRRDDRGRSPRSTAEDVHGPVVMGRFESASGQHGMPARSALATFADSVVSARLGKVLPTAAMAVGWSGIG